MKVMYNLSATALPRRFPFSPAIPCTETSIIKFFFYCSVRVSFFMSVINESKVGYALAIAIDLFSLKPGTHISQLMYVNSRSFVNPATLALLDGRNPFLEYILSSLRCGLSTTERCISFTNSMTSRGV